MLPASPGMITALSQDTESVMSLNGWLATERGFL